MMTVAMGGKPVYGVALGILMLDTELPRIPGDVGHAATWPFPVHYRIVREATPDLVVRKKAKGLLPAFITAAKALAADGADGIVGNCGFLSLFQDKIAEAVNIPVATSSLMQVALVNSTLPRGTRAGILTVSASTLTQKHLDCAGVPADTPIGTTEGGTEFTRVILGNETRLNVDKARADNVAAARALVYDDPTIGALVLECTNMIPFAASIHAATGLPVYSMETFVRWFHGALQPTRFPAPADGVMP